MCYNKIKKGDGEMALTETMRRGLEAYLAANYRPPRENFREPRPMEMYRQADCAPMAAPARKKPALAIPNLTGRLRELLEKTDAGFSETLLRLIDESGKKDSEIYGKANLSRQHFSKIRSHRDYRPTKPTALALAIALELDLEQTRDLIGRAGYALTGSSKFDVIVMYFIENRHYDMGDINDALYAFDQSLLGAEREK